MASASEAPRVEYNNASGLQVADSTFHMGNNNRLFIGG
jgi:hypothetical protein